MTVERVDDPGDPRLDDYRDLTDAALRRRREGGDGAGMFVAEGRLVLDRLLSSPYPVRSVLVNDRGLHALGDTVDGLDAPVLLAPQPVMDRVAGYHVHRGLLAVADRLPLRPAAELVEGASLVAVLEDLNDHENLGALFRNAAAFGVDAVLLSPRCADPLYRRSVRVSMGAVLHLPFTRAEPWPGAIGALADAGLTVVALTPDPAAAPIEAVAADPPARVALLLGAEGPGLAAGTLALADRQVRIAMAARVDSLNVATAAAIAFHRLARLG